MESSYAAPIGRLAASALLLQLLLTCSHQMPSAVGFGSQQQQQQQQQPQQQQQHSMMSHHHLLQQPSSSSSAAGKCERITIPLCKDMKYNMTRMPNLVGQTNQKDAALQVHEFIPLIQFGCSNLLKFFLCSLYAPMCTEQVDETLVIPACRSMCLDVKSKCEPVLERFNFQWPAVLDCNQLPERSDRTQLCIDPPDADDGDITGVLGSDSIVESITHNPEMVRLLEMLRAGSAAGTSRIAPGGRFGAGGGPVPSTRSPRPVYNSPQQRPAPGRDDQYGLLPVGSSGGHISSRDPRVHSPAMTSPSGDICGRRFVALSAAGQAGQGHPANETTICAAKCGVDVFYLSNDKRFAEIWMAVWASVCLAVTTFTVITYLLDTSRFRYPERPIVILAACSAVYSCAYIMRIAAGSDVITCQSSTISASTSYSGNVASNNKDDVTAYMVTVRYLVFDGLSNTWCIISFLVLYFFGMAGSLWWVALTVAFYLSAGRKWSREAIEARSAYFHVAGWTLPAVKTIAILALHRVDADELTGLCYVGNVDRDALVAFVVVPLLAYLIVGIAFIAAGFTAMFHIRKDLLRGGSGENDDGNIIAPGGTQTIRKLEKLMAKIGVFSVLYTVPATCVVACFLYRRMNMDIWRQRAAAGLDCGGPRKHLSLVGSEDEPDCEPLRQSIPPIEVEMLRLFMLLAGGMTSFVWICSRKTILTWYRFLTRSGGRIGSRHLSPGASAHQKQTGAIRCGSATVGGGGLRLATPATGSRDIHTAAAYRKCDTSYLHSNSITTRI